MVSGGEVATESLRNILKITYDLISLLFIHMEKKLVSFQQSTFLFLRLHFITLGFFVGFSNVSPPAEPAGVLKL